ncbi:MAG: hypothetical protein E7634_03095 [Ruminococcaceae bacterium]|nr:hypothetical protein [Oscillospiraceae bacterium]MBQ9693002.1 hypothetical protein [Clostridia bacterium]
MENKRNDGKQQKNKLKAVNKKDTQPQASSLLFVENYDSDIHTDPLGSWTGVPFDDPYDKPIQDADDL